MQNDSVTDAAGKSKISLSHPVMQSDSVTASAGKSLSHPVIQSDSVTDAAGKSEISPSHPVMQNDSVTDAAGKSLSHPVMQSAAGKSLSHPVLQSDSDTDAAGKSEIKKTKGRQKIAIAKIEDKARRKTTFSKRRKGLFNQVRDLCDRCNAEAAVITFSEVQNVFAMGTPSVDAVLNRYLARNATRDAEAENKGSEEVRRLKEKLADLKAKLEKERQKGEYLKKALELKNRGGSSAMDEADEALALEELVQFQDKWKIRSASPFPETGK